MIGCETSTQHEEPSPFCEFHPTNDKWVLYNHLPSEKDWSLQSYNVLMENIDTIEKTISLNRILPENMVKYSMLFFMRNGVTPLWEDDQNINGGCFSYKVINKYVVQVWKHMMFLAAGESLSSDSSYNECINGITISPKKNFCIVKIWLRNSNCVNPEMITKVDNLTNNGVMFKKHIEN